MLAPPARTAVQDAGFELEGDIRLPLKRARMSPGIAAAALASLVVHAAFLAWLRPGAVEGPTSPGGSAAIQVAFVMPGANAVRSRVSAGRPGAVPTAVASAPPDTADPFQTPAEPTPGLPTASNAPRARAAAAAPAATAQLAPVTPQTGAVRAARPPAQAPATQTPTAQAPVVAPHPVTALKNLPAEAAAATAIVADRPVLTAPAAQPSASTAPLRTAAAAAAAPEASSAEVAAADAAGRGETAPQPPQAALAAAPTAVGVTAAVEALASTSDSAATIAAETANAAAAAPQPGEVGLVDADAVQGGAAAAASVAPPANAPPARTLTAAPLEQRAATAGASAAARAIVDEEDVLIAQATAPRPASAQAARPAVAEAPRAGVIRAFQPRTTPPPPPLPPRRPPSLRLAERNPRIGGGALAAVRGLAPLGPAIPGIDDGRLPLGTSTMGAVGARPPVASGRPPPAAAQPRTRGGSTASVNRQGDVRPSFRGAGLNNPEPRYPYAALRRRLEGRVLLRVDVDATGRATHVIVRRSSGFPILDEAAISAVLAWRFRPAIVGGTAGPGTIDVPIEFRLR